MKGVIVAAGYGTRFLPVTKTIPKEMLPLIDKPSIDFVIEEFINSGITEILIISSRRKKSLEDYLDREIELETVFDREGATAKKEAIKPVDAEIYFVRQKEMKGTGQALMLAEPFVGKDSFVVAYPDDLHFGTPPLTSQLIDKHKTTGCSVMATIHNPPNLNRYGILALASDDLHVTDIIEKPEPGTEPSKEASIGRYLYTAEIFEYLREGWKKHIAGPNADKEYYHAYALNKLMKKNKVVYARTIGERLDTGAPAGYLRALLKYAKTIPELAEVLKEELRF